MTREDIFEKVREVLVDALAVDDDEVLPGATLTGDLGAESIDFLDIVFKLEQEFEIKINQGELFPENLSQDPEFVENGQVTDKGLAVLKEQLPHANFTALEADRQVSKAAEIFTVDAIVTFIDNKLQTA